MYIVIYNSVVCKIGEGVYIAIKLQALRLNEAAPSLKGSNFQLSRLSPCPARERVLGPDCVCITHLLR